MDKVRAGKALPRCITLPGAWEFVSVYGFAVRDAGPSRDSRMEAEGEVGRTCHDMEDVLDLPALDAEAVPSRTAETIKHDVFSAVAEAFAAIPSAYVAHDDAQDSKGAGVHGCGCSCAG
jgi:hypothetical protein